MIVMCMLADSICSWGQFAVGGTQISSENTALIFSVVGTDCAALYLAGSNVSGIYTLQPDYRNGLYQFQVTTFV